MGRNNTQFALINLNYKFILALRDKSYDTFVFLDYSVHKLFCSGVGGVTLDFLKPCFRPRKQFVSFNDVILWFYNKTYGSFKALKLILFSTLFIQVILVVFEKDK